MVLNIACIKGVKAGIILHDASTDDADYWINASMIMGTDGPGIDWTHNAPIERVRIRSDCRISSTKNDATAGSAIRLSGTNGLRLGGDVTLVAGIKAPTNSVAAAASQNLQCDGAVYANKAKSSNVTILSPGTLTADAHIA